MKSLFFTCLLIIVSINVSIAQDDEKKYPSKEEDAYYKQLPTWTLEKQYCSMCLASLLATEGGAARCHRSD